MVADKVSVDNILGAVVEGQKSHISMQGIKSLISICHITHTNWLMFAKYEAARQITLNFVLCASVTLQIGSWKYFS